MSRGAEEVAAFGRLMQEALDRNADKPGWKGLSYSGDWDFWQSKLTEEFVELMVELRRRRKLSKAAAWDVDPRIASESTDLAVICMMIADNAGALEPQPQPQRCRVESIDGRCLYNAGHPGAHAFPRDVP